MPRHCSGSEYVCFPSHFCVIHISHAWKIKGSFKVCIMLVFEWLDSKHLEGLEKLIYFKKKGFTVNGTNTQWMAQKHVLDRIDNILIMHVGINWNRSSFSIHAYQKPLKKTKPLISKTLKWFQNPLSIQPEYLGSIPLPLSALKEQEMHFCSLKKKKKKGKRKTPSLICNVSL